jgi:hypothetical protein
MKMAQLTVEIDLDNAAFDPQFSPEVARILERLAETFRDALDPTGSTSWAVRDINGNTIGQVTITY